MTNIKLKFFVFAIFPIFFNIIYIAIIPGRLSDLYLLSIVELL